MSYIKYINESIDRSGIAFFFLTKIPLDNEIVSKCKDDKCIKEMMIMAKFGITNKQYSILLFILNQKNYYIMVRKLPRHIIFNPRYRTEITFFRKN